MYLGDRRRSERERADKDLCITIIDKFWLFWGALCVECRTLHKMSDISQDVGHYTRL